jgi:hypothetical protein
MKITTQVIDTILLISLFLSLDIIILILISAGVVGITSIFSSFYLKCLMDFFNQINVHLILMISIIAFISSIILLFAINYIYFLINKELVNENEDNAIN